METTAKQKTKRAKFIGSGFFILLALIYLAFEIFYEAFIWFDLILLGLALVPVAVNKRWLSFGFGMLAAVLTLYLGFAFALAQVKSSGTDFIAVWKFLLGYFILACSLVSSLLLMYAGLNISDKKFSLI